MSTAIKPNLQLEIGHVLFIDVVGYSKVLIDDQRELAATTESNRPWHSTVPRVRNSRQTGAPANRRRNGPGVLHRSGISGSVCLGDKRGIANKPFEGAHGY